jgi:hypothetical protein
MPSHTLRLVGCLTLALTLSSCASVQNMGYGTVLQAKKIAAKDYRPQNGTLVGAGVGAGAGAATGATLGAMSGATAGVILAAGTFGIGAMFIPVLTMAGATTGAVAGGVTGGTVGAGVGYGTDMHKQGLGIYQFTVQPDNHSANIQVTQYLQQPIPKHARVQIQLKDAHYYIAPVAQHSHYSFSDGYNPY